MREHGEKKKDVSPSNNKEMLQPAITAISKILVKVGNMEIVMRAVADTGATVAIVNKTLVDRYGLEYGREWKGELTSAGRDRMAVEGRATLKIKPMFMNWEYNHSGYFYTISAVVSSLLNKEMYLSLKELKRLGMINQDFPAAITPPVGFLSYRMPS